ncbi:hypothetical protein BBJ29_007691 [Phytophthora kernoviae]|uniref:Uncharacterized protein n=1 Tax=Phytophthora kernoviae TaxID=325452 RepID=A0A3F2RG51_9STRA|nr:hypothetical protein BBJ29_007691 [Phytophthora kernoviae]RLN56121.1 hypothetical protein BBP00_00008164 [Phytophthora kernoviae]
MQQETSTQLAGKPKKKRIRRQKLELEYLRELVVKLENKMTQLKDSHTETPQTKFKPGLEADAKIRLVWKDIAQRQQKERERVEDKNKKLRVSLEGQLQLATKLQNLLRKHLRENDMEPLVNAKRFKPQPTTALGPTDDEIFADQLQHVERAHLEVDDLFGGPDFINRGELSSAMHEMHVMSDPNSDTGVAFITTANSMLPFDVKVAEKVFWRAITEVGPLKVGYVHDDKVFTENLLARSFSLHSFGAFQTNVRGKQTHRKFVDGSCAMVMWKSMVEPVEINGTKFRGLRCIQTGWIVLRGVNLADASTFTEADTLGPMMSTSLQSYSKMTLELQDDIVDQELQVGALTDFVVNSHYTIKELTGKMIKDLLLEEDWNLNGWIDNLSP